MTIWFGIRNFTIRTHTWGNLRAENPYLDNGGREKKGKVIRVTGRRGPYGCETSRLPYFLETIGSKMAVKSSALHAAGPLPPGRLLVLISVRG
jgi:hypothetical protein